MEEEHHHQRTADELTWFLTNLEVMVPRDRRLGKDIRRP